MTPNRTLHDLAALPLGEQVRLARRNAGLTQAQLARRIRKTTSMVSEIENHLALPSPRTCCAIALATGEPIVFGPKTCHLYRRRTSSALTASSQEGPHPSRA